MEYLRNTMQEDVGLITDCSWCVPSGAVHWIDRVQLDMLKLTRENNKLINFCCRVGKCIADSVFMSLTIKVCTKPVVSGSWNQVWTRTRFLRHIAQIYTTIVQGFLYCASKPFYCQLSFCWVLRNATLF